MSHRSRVWIEAVSGFERAEIIRVVIMRAEVSFAVDELDVMLRWIVDVATGEREFRAALPVAEFRQKHWQRSKYRWTAQAWTLMHQERVRIAAVRERMRALGEELRREARRRVS